MRRLGRKHTHILVSCILSYTRTVSKIAINGSGDLLCSLTQIEENKLYKKCSSLKCVCARERRSNTTLSAHYYYYCYDCTLGTALISSIACGRINLWRTPPAESFIGDLAHREAPMCSALLFPCKFLFGGLSQQAFNEAPLQPVFRHKVAFLHNYILYCRARRSVMQMRIHSSRLFIAKLINCC